MHRKYVFNSLDINVHSWNLNCEIFHNIIYIAFSPKKSRWFCPRRIGVCVFAPGLILWFALAAERQSWAQRLQKSGQERMKDFSPSIPGGFVL